MWMKNFTNEINKSTNAQQWFAKIGVLVLNLKIVLYFWGSWLTESSGLPNPQLLQATGRYGTAPNRLWLLQSWIFIFTLLRFLHLKSLPNWLNSKSEKCTELNAKKCWEKTSENILNFWTAENWNLKNRTERKKVLRKTTEIE